MVIQESHLVPFLEKAIRIQEYAVGIFKTLPTKSGIKKAIKRQLILVNGKPTTTALFITGGETIDLLENKNQKKLKTLDLKLTILFEDNYIAVIQKPAGILVSGNSFVTINNALTQNITKSNQFDAVRPRAVHRLDYPTSGLLLIGKTNTAVIALSKLFEHKEIEKTYHAITIGKMPTKGLINTAIDNKNAFTEYTVLQTVKSARFDYLNLVALYPKTGRRHQLRKHLASIGNQILGDKEYGDAILTLKGKGLYLHATSLHFTHPITKENIRINSEIPKKFKKIFPNKA